MTAKGDMKTLPGDGQPHIPPAVPAPRLSTWDQLHRTSAQKSLCVKLVTSDKGCGLHPCRLPGFDTVLKLSTRYHWGELGEETKEFPVNILQLKTL